jgi:hypothetical protein
MDYIELRRVAGLGRPLFITEVTVGDSAVPQKPWSNAPCALATPPAKEAINV